MHINTQTYILIDDLGACMAYGNYNLIPDIHLVKHRKYSLTY